MHRKTFLLSIPFLVVALGLLMLIPGPTVAAGVSGSGSMDGSEPNAASVIAYYFHTTVRCATCRKIEDLAREVVETDFQEKTASGELVWEVVNIQEPENRHFIQDFRLATKSIVLVEKVDGETGQWKNLDKVWRLIRNQEQYKKYIRTELESFLENH